MSEGRLGVFALEVRVSKLSLYDDVDERARAGL